MKRTQYSSAFPLCLILKDSLQSSRTELLLTEDGYEVITFHSARELWENFARWRPRYIITNRQFPDGYSALDLCQAVRKEFLMPYCYIHVLSWRCHLGEIEEALQAGANDYSVTPISPLQLRARVRVGLRWLQYIDSLTLDVDATTPEIDLTTVSVES